ncbi:MAG: hypothetical protein J6D47_12775 [Peptostreptococcaceae bacterium]|nr:hypothetical protein [Peptostreptococcaceae bacterium]
MIVSGVDLEVKGYKATLSKKLKFYKGDCLNISFSITSSVISQIDSSEVIEGVLPVTDNIRAYMLIGSDKVAGTIVQDNKIIFKLTPEYQTVGITELQIVLIEMLDDGSKEILHTPPFNLEIAEPIGNYEEIEEDIARVGYAIVGKSIVAGNSITYAEVELGYEEWKTGDLITADKLNKIEATIYEHTQMLDELLYKAITINNFSISKSTAELGEKLIGLILNWSYNKIPTYQKLDNVLIDNELRKYTVEKEISSNTSFKLEVSDGKTTVNRTASINFYNGRYYGVSNSETYDSDFILSLNKTLTNSRACNFTVNCGPRQYIFFAIPTRFGTPTFTVGGFSGGFNKIKTISFVNKFGYSEGYDIWKSTNSNLGNTTVVVG